MHTICRKESVSLGKGFEIILRQGGLNSNTEGGIRLFLGLIRDFRSQFRNCDCKLKGVVTELVDSIGYWDDLKRITSTPEQFAARWANVEALLDAVGQYENEQHQAGQKPSLSGFLDAGGNILYLFATQNTRLDIAALLSSLYPAATVLLSSLVLKEKISLPQWFGVSACVVAIMLISYTVAVLYKGSLVALLLYAYGPIVQFAPGVVATLLWRRASGVAVLWGMILGSALNITLVIWPELRPFEIHAGLYGLALNAIVVVAGSLAATGSRTATGDEFVRIADGR